MLLKYEKFIPFKMYFLLIYLEIFHQESIKWMKLPTIKWWVQKLACNAELGSFTRAISFLQEKYANFTILQHMVHFLCMTNVSDPVYMWEKVLSSMLQNLSIKIRWAQPPTLVILCSSRNRLSKFCIFDAWPLAHWI